MNQDQPTTLNNGQWPKGTSGNRAGRPRGSRNKSTLAMESLLEGSAEQLIHKAMEMALGGDIAALRLCLERILPPRRDRLVELDLPPTGTANQISTALETLVRSIGEGQITPAEGGMISTILTNKLNALHAEVIEGRIERLEGMMQSERSTDPQT